VRKFLPLPIGFALLSAALLGSVANATTHPVAGAACSPKGAVVNYAGKKYTCVKSGTKLVWNSGVTIVVPTTTTTHPRTTTTVATTTTTMPVAN